MYAIASSKKLWISFIVASLIGLSGCCETGWVRPPDVRAPWCVETSNAASLLHWTSALPDGTPVASGFWYEPEELSDHPVYYRVPTVRIWRDGRWQGLGNLDSLLCGTGFARRADDHGFRLTSTGMVLPNGVIYFCVLTNIEAVLFVSSPGHEAYWCELSRVSIPFAVNIGQALWHPVLFMTDTGNVRLLARSVRGVCVIPFHTETLGPTFAQPEESAEILKNVPPSMMSAGPVSCNGQEVLFSTFTSSSNAEEHSTFEYCFVDFGSEDPASPCRTIDLGDAYVPEVAAWPERHELVLSVTPRNDDPYPLRILRIRGDAGEVEYLEPLPEVLQEAARNRSFGEDISCTEEGTILLAWEEEIDDYTCRVGLASWTESGWNVIGTVEVDAPGVFLYLNASSDKAPILLTQEFFPTD